VIEDLGFGGEGIRISGSMLMIKDFGISWSQATGYFESRIYDYHLGLRD